MSHPLEKIWKVQREAAEGLRERFGADDALGYLVGEKFVNFLDAAATRPEVEAEVPAFAVRVREIFNIHELRAFFAKPPDPELAPDVEDTDAHDLVRSAEKVLFVKRAKEMLLGF